MTTESDDKCSTAEDVLAYLRERFHVLRGDFARKGLDVQRLALGRRPDLPFPDLLVFLRVEGADELRVLPYNLEFNGHVEAPTEVMRNLTIWALESTESEQRRLPVVPEP